MQGVYVVRTNDGASGVYGVYTTRAAADAAIAHLGGTVGYPSPESGAWAVIATVQDTFNTAGPSTFGTFKG